MKKKNWLFPSVYVGWELGLWFSSKRLSLNWMKKVVNFKSHRVWWYTISLVIYSLSRMAYANCELRIAHTTWTNEPSNERRYIKWNAIFTFTFLFFSLLFLFFFVLFSVRFFVAFCFLLSRNTYLVLFFLHSYIFNDPTRVLCIYSFVHM